MPRKTHRRKNRGYTWMRKIGLNKNKTYAEVIDGIKPGVSKRGERKSISV